MNRLNSTILPLLLSLVACSTDRVTVEEEPLEQVILFDQDGKQWNITQAVFRYGFVADKFLFGFGAFSVQPLVNPPMVAETEAGFPPPDSVFTVAGTGVDPDFRAYGISELLSFEVANDAAGGRAVVIVYDPLLDRVSAYLRTTDATNLTLSSSGWVYERRNVLFDYETESLWYPLDNTSVLTCINGAFLGNTLESIPLTRTQWNNWYTAHPTTRVLVLVP